MPRFGPPSCGGASAPHRNCSNSLALTPTQCIVVVASFVPGEWLAHSQPEADSLRAHLAKFDGEAERLREFCSLMKIVPPFARTEYGLLPLAERLHYLSRQLLDCACTSTQITIVSSEPTDARLAIRHRR